MRPLETANNCIPACMFIESQGAHLLTKKQNVSRVGENFCNFCKAGQGPVIYFRKQNHGRGMTSSLVIDPTRSVAFKLV